MKILSIKQLKYTDTKDKKIIILSQYASSLQKDKNILIIDCADITQKSKQAFTEEHAKRILKHIKNIDIKNIIVACDCGISRSAAVGAAILRKYKQDEKIWKSAQYTPNILIYNTICRAEGIKNGRLYLKYLQYINKRALKKAIEKTRKKV